MDNIEKSGESIPDPKPAPINGIASVEILDQVLPVIRKGKIESMSIYEMSEGELETLERGSRREAFLNSAILLLSTAISFLITLLTVNLDARPFLFTVFTVITAVGFVVGSVLLALWYKTKSDAVEVLKRIRERLEKI